MKKSITMVSILIISISISACSSKISNTKKSEDKPFIATINVEKPITSFYEELDKLPQKYSSELARKNGDVVNAMVKDYNIELLDKFFENYKNKKANVGDIIRITKFTTEGDAIICDLIIDIDGIKLIEDSTRDKFSSMDNRKITESKIIDIYKTNETESITYMAMTDKGEEKYLCIQRNSIDGRLYVNTQYGFNFSLPESWKGYTIVSGKWEGLAIGSQNGEVIVETGPLISIRHPKWTTQSPRQDIPIMVFTINQWNSLQQEKFHIGAAPMVPSELGRSSSYVFALPARYNYSFSKGYEEVENILKGNPLQVLKK